MLFISNLGGSSRFLSASVIRLAIDDVRDSSTRGRDHNRMSRLGPTENCQLYQYEAGTAQNHEFCSLNLTVVGKSPSSGTLIIQPPDSLGARLLFRA